MSRLRLAIVLSLAIAAAPMGCGRFGEEGAPGEGGAGGATDDGSGSGEAGDELSTPGAEGGTGGGGGGDADTHADGSTDATQVVLDATASGDGASDVLVIPMSFGDWFSPNGAQFTVDGGVSITGYTNYNHAVVVSRSQPAIKAGSDYTVHALVATASAPGVAEWGILARVPENPFGVNGDALVFGSAYGGGATPAMSTMGPTMWNPSGPVEGAAYTYVPGKRYSMELQCQGATARGRLWGEGETQPAWQVTHAVPDGQAVDVGFYSYFTTGAVLVSMSVTVP